MDGKLPDIGDIDFQKRIGKIFNKYKIDKEPTFKEMCWPSKYTIQDQQKFVADFINPKTPYKGILLCHKIGAGKTCAAIQIAEKWKKHKKIMFVCPASLIGNFYKELKTKCAKNEYITEKEEKLLAEYGPGTKKYDQLNEVIKKRIDKHYKIISYNKFMDLSKQNKINLSNYLLIIDEVQNVVSETGVCYQIFMKEIMKSPASTRIVVMSATPMFDKPVELALTINLLKPRTRIPVNPEFNRMFLKSVVVNDYITYKAKNMDKLRAMLQGYISYYKGAPEHTFPTKSIRYIRARMSNYQYGVYRNATKNEGKFAGSNVLELPNDFFIASRAASNVALPLAATKKMLTDDLEKYSVKFYKILKAIKKSRQLNFVYSNFRGEYGIEAFVKVLDANGFYDFSKHGPGKNRYAIWSGEECLKLRENICAHYNLRENKNGDMIKVILGSPAIKEGVSLLRVRKVHIMEPYWNMSRLEQIIGRAVRFCSHKDMPKDEREVRIYFYIAVDQNNKTNTIDKYIMNMAFSKNKLIGQFEDVLKQAAVDYYLFQR